MFKFKYPTRFRAITIRHVTVTVSKWRHGHFRSGGFNGQAVFSHNVGNGEAYEEFFLVKAGVVLVFITYPISTLTGV